MEYELLLLNIVRDLSVNPGFRDCIGQHCIASYLGDRDFKAKVYSGSTINIRKIVSEEIQRHKVQAVGFYVAADNYTVTANLISWIKSEFDVITILGGPEAVAVDEAFFEHTHCDYAIVGEGEESVYRLLRYSIDGLGSIDRIGGLVYLDEDNKLCRNKQNKPIMNLDLIPYPKFENSLNKNFRQSEMVGIITGRGCPFSCAFCYEGANAKSVRFRSIANVMEEIDYILENNDNLKYINIYDDTFTLDTSRVVEFCDEIAKRNVRWFCEGHISNIVKNAELVNKMSESGLISMQLGIESGSESVLKAYNKKTNPDMIAEAVRICKDAGLACVSGNFIVGGAWETRETVSESMELAKKLLRIGRGVFDCRTVFLAPYPNTRIADAPEKFGLRLVSKAFDSQLTSMRSPVMETETLSVEEIEHLKSEFDKMLVEEYYKQAKESVEADVVAAFFYKGNRVALANRWQNYYRQVEHINNFVAFYNPKHDVLDMQKYIIRTIETFGDFIFSDDEKKLLSVCVGKLQAWKICDMLCWNHEHLADVYKRLRMRCMVYQSEL